ncbi:putative SIR2 family histone deacetylase [Geopyxis carbonaria]|nr:putative SIR2 family histone deacetylase [Geopyxis carbonaria]
MGNEPSRPAWDPSIAPSRLKDRTLPALAAYILENPHAKLLFLTGAGISTSAGIPDFRSPTTGLYSSLARLDLPTPESIFDIGYFRTNPAPFYTLAQELWPGRYRPTLTHCFIAIAARQGRLLKVFTQNVDTLELAAGIPRDKIVFAHGSFAAQSCIDCKAPYTDRDGFEAAVREARVVYCPAPCGGLVKPDITFFGEALPAEFHDSLSIVGEADVAVVMGSSLSVYPFAALPQQVPEDVPRLLVNRELAGDLGTRREDVTWLGGCDEGVKVLAEALGWWDEVVALWRSFRVGEGVMGVGLPELEESLEERLAGEDGGLAEERDARLLREVEAITAEVEKGMAVSERHEAWVREQLEKERGRKAEMVVGAAPPGAPEREVEDVETSSLKHVFPHLESEPAATTTITPSEDTRSDK